MIGGANLDNDWRKMGGTSVTKPAQTQTFPRTHGSGRLSSHAALAAGGHPSPITAWVSVESGEKWPLWGGGEGGHHEALSSITQSNLPAPSPPASGAPRPSPFPASTVRGGGSVSHYARRAQACTRCGIYTPSCPGPASGSPGSWKSATWTTRSSCVSTAQRRGDSEHGATGAVDGAGGTRVLGSGDTGSQDQPADVSREPTYPVCLLQA